jgi:hypothetical protein
MAPIPGESLPIRVNRASRDRSFLDNVQSELKSARLQFPTNENQFVALTEEVGELAQALIDQGRGFQSATDVYAEAVQVAAMALRVAVDGDSSFPKYLPPPMKDRDVDSAVKLSDKAKDYIKENHGALRFAFNPAGPPYTAEELTKHFSPGKAQLVDGKPCLRIQGWLAIINDKDAPDRTGVPEDPPFYVCPTIWPDRYAALKVYGEEKIAAFIPLNTYVGENT